MAVRNSPRQDEPRLGAALFNGDHGRLAEEVSRIEESGLDFVHLDVFDGHFIPDLGFPPITVEALRPLTDLPFEVHLGAVNPLRFVPQLVDAGVDLILLHLESVSMPYEAISAAREHGTWVGLVLSLGTPLTRLEPVLGLVDAVLLLSRATGESVRDAAFDSLVLPRVRSVRELVEATGAPVDIQVAGGVKRDHVSELVAAGADTLALGGTLYKAPDMAREVEELRAAMARVG